jgi:hypothetical protein
MSDGQLSEGIGRYGKSSEDCAFFCKTNPICVIKQELDFPEQRKNQRFTSALFAGASSGSSPPIDQTLREPSDKQ